MSTLKIRTLLATEGRIDRTTFIAWLSLYSVAFYSCYLVIYLIADFIPTLVTSAVAMITLSLITILCIPLLIRRAHDFDESSWFAFMVFIPLVNLMFFISPGSPIRNRFGDVPPDSSVPTKVMAILYPVWPIAILWAILWSARN